MDEKEGVLGEYDYKPRWRLDTTLTLGVLLTLILQTSAGVWWAARMTEGQTNLKEQFDDYKADRYTRDDARRDLALMQNRYEENARRLNVLENSLSNHIATDIERFRRGNK